MDGLVRHLSCSGFQLGILWLCQPVELPFFLLYVLFIYLKSYLDMNEIGQEHFQSRNHKDSLSGIAISSALTKVATCGDGSVKVHEMGDLKDVYAILSLEDDRGMLCGMEWTDDGGFLTVGTKK